MSITDEQVKAAQNAYADAMWCFIKSPKDAMRAALEAAEAIGAQAKRIEHLEMQLRLAVNSDSEYCKTVEADNAHLKICIAELEAENAKLREALKKAEITLRTASRMLTHGHVFVL